MAREIRDVTLKTAIKERAIKNGINAGICTVRYDGCMYLVDFDNDTVVHIVYLRMG